MGHHYRVQFKQGDVVVIQDPQTKLWSERGEVVIVRGHAKGDASVSYWIDTGASRLKLRNKKYLRLSTSRLRNESTSNSWRVTFQDEGRQNRF